MLEFLQTLENCCLHSVSLSSSQPHEGKAIVGEKGEIKKMTFGGDYRQDVITGRWPGKAKSELFWNHV